MSDIDKIVHDANAAMLDQQDAWLRSLGIKTEADARLISEYWAIDEGPIKLVETEDGGMKFTRTARLVRRVPENVDIAS